MNNVKFLSKDLMLHVKPTADANLPRSYVIDTVTPREKDVLESNGLDRGTNIKDDKDVNASANEKPDC